MSAGKNQSKPVMSAAGGNESDVHGLFPTVLLHPGKLENTPLEKENHLPNHHVQFLFDLLDSSGGQLTYSRSIII